MTGAASKASHRLTVRPAGPGDARDVWLWRNDPVTRKYSGDATPVPWEEHVAWFSARLNDPGCAIYMAHAPDKRDGPGKNVAVARFDRSTDKSGHWTISLNVCPGARGRGLGRETLTMACRAFFEAHGHRVLRAEIHPDNVASMRVFMGLGFFPLEMPQAARLKLFERPPHALPHTNDRRGS